MEIELRDYQQATKERVVRLYQENPQGNAKFVWATGLGKTIGFSAIADEILKQSEVNVLIVAHREELLNQAVQKYHFLNPDMRIGKVGNGCFEWGCPVTVASIQTLARPQHLRNAQQFDFAVIIVDECHHATNDNEYGKVLAAFPRAFRIGCTATDDRLDKKTNDDLFGESMCTVSILDAIEQGYLAPVKAIAIKTGINLDGLHTNNGDYQVKELAEKIDTPERNRKIVEKYLEHASDRQAMAFTVDIAHAMHIAEAFCEAGVSAVAVSGNTPNRGAILRDFEQGNYRVLCNCQVFTEGYDAETTYDEDVGRYIFLSCAIMARPTKSRALYTQCIGRILRLAPTKTDALILDATDNILNHRLEPQSLARVVGIDDLRDGETVLEAKERKEAVERQKRERTTAVHRTQDMHINVLARLQWQSRADGKFVLEIGLEKHRIALVSSDTFDGYYRIVAKLAPYYEAQYWSGPLPLDWAQSEAEKKARLLLSDSKNTVLLDKTARWRGDPATPVQLEKLAKYAYRFHLVYDPANISKGEASDLLDTVYGKFEQWRNKKALAG